MKKLNQSTGKQFGTYIGVDLGDKKHAICVTDNDGNILHEFSIANRAESLGRLAEEFPKASVAMEAGTHSPWASRLLAGLGLGMPPWPTPAS